MTAALTSRRRGSEVGVPLCESCGRLPAVVTVAWPDTDPFAVCAGCTPTAAAAVRGVS